MARSSAEVNRVIRWYEAHARPLPWREADVTPWGILVSEFMAQQTQVDRAVAKWQEWLSKWPTPASLADAPIADVLKAWQGLGYPRRALRLHASAQLIVEKFNGEVPRSESELLSLPGVGHYTAAAVAAFAYGEPTVVLDTNIRRVIARAWSGQESVPSHLTTSERTNAKALVSKTTGARWSAAVMELGALICKARAPKCQECPLRGSCLWLAAGRPDNGPPMRKQPSFEGSDRQARGTLLKAISEERGMSAIEMAWADEVQRDRALASLVADGLVARTPRGYALPGN